MTDLLPPLSRHIMARALERHITPQAIDATLARPDHVWPTWTTGAADNLPSPSLGYPALAYQRGALRVIFGSYPPGLVTTMWDFRMAGRHPDAEKAHDLIATILTEEPPMDWNTPTPVDDVDLAFPSRGITLTPTDDVPADFTPAGWGDLVSHLFAHGSDDSLHLIPKRDIEAEVAWRHIRVVLGCYGLKHEQKVRGAAWLLSLWFEAAIWDTHNGECEAGDHEVATLLREAHHG